MCQRGSGGSPLGLDGLAVGARATEQAAGHRQLEQQALATGSARVRPRWQIVLSGIPSPGCSPTAQRRRAGAAQGLTCLYRDESSPTLGHPQLVAGTWPSCVSSDSMS